jgi:hypothetical protein
MTLHELQDEQLPTLMGSGLIPEGVLFAPLNHVGFS